MPRKRVIEPGERIPIRFTAAERKLILEHTYAGGALTARLSVALVNGSRLTVQYSLEDLDELLGFIAAEANHSKDQRLAARLYRLYDRLSDIEQSTIEMDS
jgi:hypothetical protein